MALMEQTSESKSDNSLLTVVVIQKWLLWDITNGLSEKLKVAAGPEVLQVYLMLEDNKFSNNFAIQMIVHSQL